MSNSKEIPQMRDFHLYLECEVIRQYRDKMIQRVLSFLSTDSNNNTAVKQIPRKIYYHLSPNMRLGIRKIFYWPNDAWNTVVKSRHKYEPPKGDIYVGSGGFIDQGVHQLELLKIHIDLKPEDTVLDVGSGIGRTAVALTNYLSLRGKYEGFDVVAKGVKWCNDRIKKDFPNFNFLHTPLNNDLYNKHLGKAEEYKFPYKSKVFDKVFLFSVFTHMLPSEIKNYLIEIKRVLKPGGLCLATFFIYDGTNEKEIGQNRHFSFPIDKGTYRLMSNRVKSANIAVREDLLDALIEHAGLEKIKVVEGYWKRNIKRSYQNDFQDIIILKT